MNGTPVSLDCGGRQERTGWLVHERHELVGETRHGASNTDSPNVWTTANSAHPSSFAHIALDNRPPATQLHDAQRRTVFLAELSLLIEATAIAPFMDRIAEKPCGAQRVVQRNHGCAASGHVEQIKQRLHEVVRLHRTPRDANNGNARLRAPSPAQVIGEPHASGWVALHRMDSAIRCACSSSQYRPCFRRQPVDPVTRCYGLTGGLVGPKRCPISSLFVSLIRNGPLHHQDERSLLAFRRQMEMPHEFIAIFNCKERIIEIYFRNPRKGPTDNVLDARLRGSRHCDRISIATEAPSHPQNIDLRNGHSFLVRSASRLHEGKIPSLRPGSAALRNHATIFGLLPAAVNRYGAEGTSIKRRPHLNAVTTRCPQAR